MNSSEPVVDQPATVVPHAGDHPHHKDGIVRLALGAIVFGINVAAGGTAPAAAPVVAVPPTAKFDENGVKQA